MIWASMIAVWPVSNSTIPKVSIRSKDGYFHKHYSHIPGLREVTTSPWPSKCSNPQRVLLVFHHPSPPSLQCVTQLCPVKWISHRSWFWTPRNQSSGHLLQGVFSVTTEKSGLCAAQVRRVDKGRMGKRPRHSSPKWKEDTFAARGMEESDEI